MTSMHVSNDNDNDNESATITCGGIVTFETRSLYALSRDMRIYAHFQLIWFLKYIFKYLYLSYFKFQKYMNSAKEKT